MDFKPFFFDGNQWFDVVDCLEKFLDLLGVYGLEHVLGAKMAPQKEIDVLPPRYHIGSAASVRTGKMPSFGFRREHISGTVTLEEWANERSMDLRSIAKAVS